MTSEVQQVVELSETSKKVLANLAENHKAVFAQTGDGAQKWVTLTLPVEEFNRFINLS
jgi:Trk K+ transport system NAD-binding subunit